MSDTVKQFYKEHMRINIPFIPFILAWLQWKYANAHGFWETMYKRPYMLLFRIFINPMSVSEVRMYVFKSVLLSVPTIEAVPLCLSECAKVITDSGSSVNQFAKALYKTRTDRE